MLKVNIPAGIPVVRITFVRTDKFEERKCANNDVVAEKILRPYFDGIMDHHEAAFAMYLDNSCNVLGVLQISDGISDQTAMDARTIFQGALLLNASAIILAHNHPSGNVKPSKADIKLTERIAELANMMGLKLHDHLILTSEKYYSMQHEGMMPFL